MAEYINRERARNEFAAYFRDSKQLVDDCDDLLCHLPTADVVEVVRCKDCKWFVPAKMLDPLEYPNDLEADGLCANIDKYTDGDRYCSSGAKMEGKGENDGT